MRSLSGAFSGFSVGLVLVLALIHPAWAGMQETTDFPVPHAHCMHPAKGRILTSVGSFSDLYSEDKFEVVADTKLDPPDTYGGPTQYEDPSINIFNKACELVWRQSYPQLGEVGFETLNPPGMPMLFVSAVSVFAPVDQVIADQELLAWDGEGFFSELSFGGDRYDTSYVGPMGTNGGFGVVDVMRDYETYAITGQIYRWKTFIDQDDPKQPPGHEFVGPEILTAQQVAALKLPAIPPHPPYPLFKFVFGYNDPG